MDEMIDGLMNTVIKIIDVYMDIKHMDNRWMVEWKGGEMRG